MDSLFELLTPNLTEETKPLEIKKKNSYMFFNLPIPMFQVCRVVEESGCSTIKIDQAIRNFHLHVGLLLNDPNYP